MRRRSLLLSCLGAATAAPAIARPQGPHPRSGALRVGSDSALIESGLAQALQQGFVRDIGLRVQLVADTATAVLDALAAGELDAGLTNAADLETGLERQGLVHDRRPIASGEFVVVGPSRSLAREIVSLDRSHGIAGLLAALADAATLRSGALVFLSANDGSGSHLAEQKAWRAARIAPPAPWYRVADPATGLIAQARARGACAFVERGAWQMHGGAPLALLGESGPESIEPVHAMRSFRSPHPVAKLFVGWVAGARGRAVVAAQRAYRVPSA